MAGRPHQHPRPLTAPPRTPPTGGAIGMPSRHQWPHAARDGRLGLEARCARTSTSGGGAPSSTSGARSAAGADGRAEVRLAQAGLLDLGVELALGAGVAGVPVAVVVGGVGGEPDVVAAAAGADLLEDDDVAVRLADRAFELLTLPNRSVPSAWIVTVDETVGAAAAVAAVPMARPAAEARPRKETAAVRVMTFMGILLRVGRDLSIAASRGVDAPRSRLSSQNRRILFRATRTRRRARGRGARAPLGNPQLSGGS